MVICYDAMNSTYKLSKFYRQMTILADNVILKNELEADTLTLL
jgi:hypothetical protein